MNDMMAEPTLDSWTTVFLLAGTQGLFLFAILMFKKRSVPNVLIGTMVFLFSITLIEYVGFWSNYRFVWPHLNNISIAFPLLFGPLVYGYIELVSKRRQLEWKDSLHAIPFGTVFLSMVPYYFLDADTKLAYMSGGAIPDPGSILSFMFSNLHLFLIAHLMGYLLLCVGKIRTMTNSDAEMKSWFQKIAILFGGYVLGFISYYIMMYTIGYVLLYDYFISFVMSTFIYLIGYNGYVRPQVFEYKSKAEIEEAKYKNSGLSQEKSVQLKEDLQSLVKGEKVYLNRDLKLDDLAEKLNVSKHHISQVLNNELQSTFSQFINAYRVEEAKRILAKGKNGLNMHGIAIESGFNNKTTFNLAFKRHTGLTPSQYRSQKAPLQQ